MIRICVTGLIVFTERVITNMCPLSSEQVWMGGGNALPQGGQRPGGERPSGHQEGELAGGGEKSGGGEMPYIQFASDSAFQCKAVQFEIASKPNYSICACYSAGFFRNVSSQP